MTLLWTKWVLVGLFGLAGVSALSDIKKHGDPRTPYHAGLSAWTAMLAFLLVLWLVLVVP
jgi:divalent metal cation (Fe/Co/Zn/Cd) transporter